VDDDQRRRLHRRRDQSGFCRTGDWFAVNHEGVIPDIVATAKGLAAACVGRRYGSRGVMNAVHEAGSAEPTAATRGLRGGTRTIKTLRDRNLVERAREIGDILSPTCVPWPRTSPSSATCATWRDGRDGVRPARHQGSEPRAVKAIVNYCNQNGVIAISCGTYGNVVRLLPPLVITDAQLADGLDSCAPPFVPPASSNNSASTASLVGRLGEVTLDGGGRIA